MPGLDGDPEEAPEVVGPIRVVVEGLKRLPAPNPLFDLVEVTLPAEPDQLDDPTGVRSWGPRSDTKGRVRVLPGVNPEKPSAIRVGIHRWEGVVRPSGASDP
jgi:hypothetical protein